MALNLNSEAQTTAGGVRAYSGIQDCLESLRIGTPPRNTQLLAERLDPVIQPILEPNARARSFQLGPLLKHEIEIYATDQLDRVSLGFNLCYTLVDERKSELPAREEASVMASGTCFLSKATDVISELVLSDVSFSWSDTEGNRHQSANVLFSTRIGAGRNMVPYVVRGPVGR